MSAAHTVARQLLRKHGLTRIDLAVTLEGVTAHANGPNGRRAKATAVELDTAILNLKKELQRL